MAVNLFTNGAGGNTWGTAGNWSLGTIPTASDGHDTTFDATSPNCTVNASNRVCNRITFVGYTNTITMTFRITVSGNVTLDAGMGISGSGDLVINTGSTITSNGKTWPNNLSSTGSSVTLTLVGDLIINGLLTIGSVQTLNKTTTETLTLNGGLNIGIVSTTSSWVGSAKVILTGGTWSHSNLGNVGLNLDIQGNVTISGNVYYRNGTITYVSGTITVTSSTLNLVTSCTLATSGITWNNITLSNTTALTYTINSLLSASGTLTIGTGATTTFAGTAGFSVGTLSCANTTATTINFKESITYTITTFLSAYFSRTGSIVLFTSSHATTKANLVLSNGAACNCLASFTRIDASGGRPIRSWNGAITDCINIVNFQDLKSYAT